MINQTLVAVVTREMPDQPSEAREWFCVFLRTAVALRNELSMELDEFRSCIRALDRIIDHYQIA